MVKHRALRESIMARLLDGTVDGRIEGGLRPEAIRRSIRVTGCDGAPSQDDFDGALGYLIADQQIEMQSINGLDIARVKR